MPCRDGGPSQEDIIDELQEERQQLNTFLAEALDLLELIVDENCFILGVDDDFPDDNAYVISSGLSTWWKEHSKLEDAKIKKEALAKLSPKEKRVLGLK